MRKQGFTLIEILIAMSILVIGLVGILALFPAGLNATRKAIEDTNAAIIADSLYSSLRSAAKKTVPGGKLEFFHDGMDPTSGNNKFPKNAIDFKTTEFTTDKCIGIPNCHYLNGAALTSSAGALVDITKYRVVNYTTEASKETASLEILAGDFCDLGRSSTLYGITPTDTEDQLKQYSYNIQISRPSTNPDGLYDVVIRIARGQRLVRTFYSKVMIPTE